MTEEEPTVQPPRLPDEARPWHQRRLVIVLGLLSVGPLALPLVWLHPKWRWYGKLYITLSVIGLTWACWVLTKAMLEHLRETLRVIEELGL